MAEPERGGICAHRRQRWIVDRIEPYHRRRMDAGKWSFSILLGGRSPVFINPKSNWVTTRAPWPKSHDALRALTKSILYSKLQDFIFKWRNLAVFELVTHRSVLLIAQWSDSSVRHSRPAPHRRGQRTRGKLVFQRGECYILSNRYVTVREIARWKIKAPQFQISMGFGAPELRYTPRGDSS